MTDYQVVDLRDPNYTPDSRWPREVENFNEVEAMVALNPPFLYLYRWGEGNRVPWAEVVDKTFPHNNPNQYAEDVITKGGSLIIDQGHGWGNPSKFSAEIKQHVQPVLDAGLIKPSAKVYVGNWASRRGKYVGQAKEFVNRMPIPMKLEMYHGTTNWLAEDILAEGLKPKALSQPIWKKIPRGAPSYRLEAVYLTSDKSQAHYYAQYATNVMRRRGYRNVKPVVLKITIPKRAYKNLQPDDDYLRVMQENEDPTWLKSLGKLSQVAYVGSIPPEWIQVESKGVGREYDEPKVAKGSVMRKQANPDWWVQDEDGQFHVNLDGCIPVKEILEVFEEMIGVQCSPGNYDMDPYMHGLANGMIYMKSLVDGEEPQYMEAPDRWLDDIPDPEDSDPVSDYDEGFGVACEAMAHYVQAANPQVDAIYRDKAERVYEELVDNIKNPHYEQDAIFLHDGMLMFPLRTFGIFEYPNVAVVVGPAHEGIKGAAGVLKEGSIIVDHIPIKYIIHLNVLPDSTYKLTNPRDVLNSVANNLDKHTWIHEFIHILDYQRSDNQMPGMSQVQTYSDYISTPSEFNAFYQERAHSIQEKLDKMSKWNLARVMFDFDSFLEFAIEQLNEHTPEFYQSLTPKYRRKFQSRLYKFYEDLMERYYGPAEYR